MLGAYALGATHRTRTWVTVMLREMGARNAQGNRYTGEQVRDLQRGLAEAGWLVEKPREEGYWQVHPKACSTVLLPLIDRGNVAELRAALARAERFDESNARGYLPRFSSIDTAIAIVRLEVFSGRPLAQVDRLKHACPWGASWSDVLRSAVVDDLDEALFGRLESPLQIDILFNGLANLNQAWRASSLELPVVTRALLARRDSPDTYALRMTFVEHLLWAGCMHEIDAVLQPLQQSDDSDAYWRAMVQVANSARHSLQGDWSQAEAGYEQALAAIKQEVGKRKALLPDLLGVPYVLALLAQQTPVHLQKALKFCLNESGRRQVVPDTLWGVMALAVQMRSGDQPRDMTQFDPYSRAPHLSHLDLWKWFMRAWLKQDAKAQTLTEAERAAFELLRKHVVAAGLNGLAAQLDAALQVLTEQSVPAWFFVPSAQDSWRVALSALSAIAAPESAVTGGTAGETRLVWVLRLGAHGSVAHVAPCEQKRGLRGWGKPKPVSLSKLAKTETLQPWDAAVARALRRSAYESQPRLDLAQAISALVAHPALEFEDNPGVAVALAEASPEIDVVDQGETLHVCMQPTMQLAPQAPEDRYVYSVAEQKERDALRSITVLRDSPQRARLIRLTPAQRRVAQLVGSGLTVPKAGAEQLQHVLHGLGAHFQVHVDELQAARDVPAETPLRAELAPQGAGVSLRLVVAPFGTDGPRVAPGSGRARMIAAVRGETLAALRDLAQERAHLESVLDACPMLTPSEPGDASCEWLIETPDDALALVEKLHVLPAVGALDWPQGRAIRVDTAALSQLRVQVRSASDWLTLQGGIAVDESLVFGLTQLLEWSSTGKSRFIPLGEGRYLALTQELRARLDDLSSVAEVQQGQARLAPVAAAWLDAALEGAQIEADKGFRERVERLVSAQQSAPVLPDTLQAQLRPYQEEGYQWAMRLAEAGFGACLADDMGLGKTLQALAVLLSRARGGAALLIAPTSLIGNWQAEARRFAPMLQMQVFGDGERDVLVENAGAGDVILVSYALHQQNAAVFAQREWCTLVLDEAQAIKNAAAKRALAVFEMKAAFRMALSGTPIENRLAELWSIMRACNPGLLGTLARFNERFAIPIERDRNRTAQRTLRRLIAPFVLRRTKAQVLDDLPPRTELTLTVQAEAAERAHYEALRRLALDAAQNSLASDAPGLAHINILAQLTKLRRAACDPRLVSPQLGYTGAKVTAFAELANELVANGHKALVFSQFVDFLALLREPLDAAGIKYQYLDGSTPSAERTRRVAAFQGGEGHLFLISLKAGGFGLNLTVADYVVIADPWWNPASEDQASGRAHRIGQQRPVTVYRLVNGGTLEERIVALHQSKRELADSVLEGSEVAGALRADELVTLMQGE